MPVNVGNIKNVNCGCCCCRKDYTVHVEDLELYECCIEGPLNTARKFKNVVTFPFPDFTIANLEVPDAFGAIGCLWRNEEIATGDFYINSAHGICTGDEVYDSISGLPASPVTRKVFCEMFIDGPVVSLTIRPGNFSMGGTTGLIYFDGVLSSADCQGVMTFSNLLDGSILCGSLYSPGIFAYGKLGTVTVTPA